ncbi:DNA-binding transcriptional LysR family regulator [Nocardioides luteus]|uniref:LysR family transcriptional regulator n=1 Tax=Nocardioides luteus TaxID=1844 RepID=A0ABQ5T1T5_9ACTN|nr:LysR family transcriptional regulator [Nocardioides luteus]MDR7311686.1 DNA-binding transcriptional LysR family regulator [Nocardioides luteus]GGR72456.1 LysR family transcriptional regulator [Nocardioides luteus]GLJ70024.1 LysR family transcriptional regulator [Nocardioides luteus]
MLIGQTRGVRVLCEVAAQGSFSAAARTLGMTQSAVSQHVAALERETGLALVDRGTRPLELTEAGAILVRHGRAVLAQLDGAEQALGALAGRRAGRLRLGSFPTALTTFVPQAVRRLRASAPDLLLTVVDDHMQGLVPRLASGELDLAVVYQSLAQPDDTLDRMPTQPLFDDPYRALLPAGHRLTRRTRPIPLADLADEVWIGGRPGSSWFRILLQACRAAGFEPRTLLTTDDHRAVQAFVAAGLGVGVVPGLAASFPSPGVVVRDLAPGAPARRIGVARPPGDPVPPPVTSMTRILREITRERSAPAARPRP